MASVKTVPVEHVCSDNVTIQVDGDKLVITCDLKRTCGPSKSGKTEIVASTGGFVSIGGVGVSVNITRKRGGQ